MACLSQSLASVKANEVLGSLSSNLQFMNFELRDVLQAYVPIEQRLKVSEQIDAILAQLDTYSMENEDDLYQKAVALEQKAGLLAQSDDADVYQVFALHQGALAIKKALAATFPEKLFYQQAQSVSYNMIGDIQLRLGNTDAALEAYQQALTIDKQLVAQDAQNTGF